MCLVPMKINDGRPRNSIGQLESIAVKYGGIHGHELIGECYVHSYQCVCKPSISRWIKWLTKELQEDVTKL